MKKIIFIFLLNAGSNIHLSAQVSNSYSYTDITYPVSSTFHNSFFVNELHQILLPLNGGIYLPENSIWFLPPTKGFYFTSIAPDQKDTGIYVINNAKDSSELYYLKGSKKAPVSRILLTRFSKGLYNIIYKNDLIYIWGFDANFSKIGILTSKGINWIVKKKTIIQQVQVNDRGEIFFAQGNSIYKLPEQKKVLIFNKKIWGFDFNKNDEIVFSSEEGIGIKTNLLVNIVASGEKGLLNVYDEIIYLLPPVSNHIYVLKRN